jgi:hypothetical protein
MGFQTRRYDLMYMKTKEKRWKENHGIQNTGIIDSQGNIIGETRDKYFEFIRIILQSSTINLINQKTEKLNLKRK